ncbi:MAG TPA: hypothetical protein VMU57_20260 [Edaphobacter sp.]|uniref:hypothetical protein n=1 Tax=Edaphobacter sp. TaxID=1934404 RepID=UPI002CFACDA2|nr:hypothetical protein [Edaphobacter sp.]HUZ97245.1 hypothetical protein [Edaphobacter sp.]
MSTTQFPAAGPSAGISSQIELNRAKPVVLRNSRFLCWVTMSGACFAAIISVCLALVVFSIFSTNGGLNAANAWSAAQWGFGVLAFGYMCPWFWKLGRAMLNYRAVLDSRGVNFSLGTKKKPADLFLAWDQIAAIKSRRAVNVQQFWVQGSDGSEARFSSFTFFRPKKVARLIAERTGLSIQKV